MRFETRKKISVARSYIVGMPSTALNNWCVKVPKLQGEHVRRELNELGILDERHKIELRHGQLYIPVKGRPRGLRYGLITCASKPRPQVLRRKLGIRYDVIGDIAILSWFKGVHAAAQELLETRKDVNVVLAATSSVSGQYRLKNLTFVAGERRTQTLHKEYGCKLQVDVASAYFSPRLATERHRIVCLAQVNETVVDMFAGVGPFTVLLAKKVKKGIAFEKNPLAFRCLQRNIKLNNLHNVEALSGDAEDLARKFKGAANRVIMDLPHSAFNFLDDAGRMLSGRGGVVHYYDAKPENEFAQTVKRVREAVDRSNRTVESISFKKVRSYAPRQYHIVLDIKISPL